ncbi:xylulokinase [Rossellomorea vietnamensis]|uniref:xylulokinase n=1 Tax=Rossellomorea vietnamensis TaxID=218284 RepID=UPI001E513A40|nr:xylulokinase [Rossellomorea vietnamensis]MCC5801765.1 xylulokinase [Rossellomorea vietnamensis]
MDQTVILSHDIGTTGNKATLFSSEGDILGSTFYGYETFFPQVGWAEQNPFDWWKAVCVSTKSLLEKTNTPNDSIACITFSGQMMGCVAVDERGTPLQQAIIWADMRAEKEAKDLIDKVGLESGYQITGHRISSSYSGAKMVWLKNNQPDVYQRTYKFLQAKDFLVQRLTGVFATDFSDASGTNLLNITTKEWSEPIIEAWGIDRDKLPPLYPSTEVIGGVTKQASEETGLLPGTPVVIGGGDGVCAAVGAGVIEEGEAFNYIGSSAWIAAASKEPVFDPEMKTYTWIHLDSSKYSPNGTMQTGGASLQWVKEQFYQNESCSVYDVMNREAEVSNVSANKLIYLPYLLGERSPRWNPDARGAFIGLHMKHTRGDMTRAVMEGVAFNLKIVLDTFLKAGLPIHHMWVLGGGAKSQVWRQILADIYGLDVYVPGQLDEATSMGAAIAGGVGVGLLKDFSVAKDWLKRSSVHSPNPNDQMKYQEFYPIFEKAYDQLVMVYAQLNQFESGVKQYDEIKSV